jgi:hypothetical protein
MNPDITRLREIASAAKNGTAYLHGGGHHYGPTFQAAFSPATCIQLLDRLERLEGVCEAARTMCEQHPSREGRIYDRLSDALAKLDEGA